LKVANEEHVARLKKGVDAWNTWHREHVNNTDMLTGEHRIPDLSGSDLHLRIVDLSGSDLHNADLQRVCLQGANLSGANLMGAHLSDAYLQFAYLGHANLSGADLMGADLWGAILSGADLSNAYLNGVDLHVGHLNDADLRNANLSGVDLSNVNLTGADLRNANLHRVIVMHANLRGAKLSGSNLSGAYLSGADLTLADLTEARLGGTVFADIDFTGTIGLTTCEHSFPSIIDHRTLQKSGSLPISFLRGVGLPDNLIEYLPALFNQAIQYYSCFISYSAKDEEFAKRIHADLQNSGVRCWFAPHNLPIGEKILDGIDAAIQLRDKVLLILSENSIRSEWVEDEVKKGFEEERKRKQIVLFPVRIDDAVMTTAEPWAAKLRERNIGDFLRWKDHDAYKQSFDRVLRDLKHPTNVAQGNPS
jgi:uncharacterized protein YjbI with pentapeptide repeats